MTEGFASAVTVSIPIFALAAGAEARTIRDRVKRADQAWERKFAEYTAEHELDPDWSAAEVFAYFKGVPAASRLRAVERALALAGAAVWLAVFVLLTIAELRSLVWLADGEPRGYAGLATFSVLAIGLAMAVLIVAPTLYLAVPLLLPLDLVPASLKRAVLPKLGTERGRGFLRQVFAELEGAIDRAAEKLENEASVQDAAPAPGGQPDSGTP
jgi:hypothetical protein